MTAPKGLAAAALLASAAVAAAETEVEADDIITVVATRSERAIDDVAATVSVKTAEEIERELAQDIADLVRFEPGVAVAGAGSRFGLAGFSIRGIGGNRVLTVVDGVRVPEEFSFGPFLSARRDFVDLDSLSRAEIARGPISALYGSDALGGVVAFTTKRPRDYLDGAQPFAAAFKGGYAGADGSVVGTASLAGQTDAASGMAVYTRRSSSETDTAGSVGGTGAGRERPDPQDIGIANLTAKIAFSPTDAHTLTLGFDRYSNNADTRILSDYGSISRGTVVDSRDAADARRRSRWSLDYRGEAALGIADAVHVIAYRQDSETRQETYEERTPPSRQAQTRLRTSLYQQDIHGISAVLSKEIGSGGIGHLVSYGAEFHATSNATMRDGGTFDAAGMPVREFMPLPTRDFPLTEVTQWAAFVQDEVTLAGGRLTLSPSIRYDHFEADARADSIYLSGNPGAAQPAAYQDGEFTAKIGAVYAPGERFSLFARYSEGFRAPPYDDVNVGFTNFLGGYKTISNPDLQSERSAGIEAGIRLRIGGARSRAAGGSVQIAAFRNDYENFIESFALAPQFLRTGGIDPADGLRAFQSVNRAAVAIQGIESTARFRWDSGLSARLAIAYAEGEDSMSGAPLDSIEPLTGVFGIGYAAPGDRWGAQAIWSLAAAKEAHRIDAASGRPETAGYGIVDILAHARIGERTRINVGLFNITDKRYLRWADTAGIGVDAPGRFTGPGFNVGATLRVDF